MIEVLLTIIVLSVLGYHAWYVHEKNKEISKLVNALVARTTEQFRDLELTEKVRAIETPKVEQPDLVPESEVSDEKFAELIEKEMLHG